MCFAVFWVLLSGSCSLGAFLGVSFALRARKMEENRGKALVCRTKITENGRKFVIISLLRWVFFLARFFFLAARVSFSLPGSFSLLQAAEKLKERLALRAREIKGTYSLYISYMVLYFLRCSLYLLRRCATRERKGFDFWMI